MNRELTSDETKWVFGSVFAGLGLGCLALLLKLLLWGFLIFVAIKLLQHFGVL